MLYNIFMTNELQYAYLRCKPSRVHPCAMCIDRHHCFAHHHHCSACHCHCFSQTGSQDGCTDISQLSCRSQTSSFQRASASRSLAVCMTSPCAPCMPAMTQKASQAAVRRCPASVQATPAGVTVAATLTQMLSRNLWLCSSQRWVHSAGYRYTVVGPNG